MNKERKALIDSYAGLMASLAQTRVPAGATREIKRGITMLLDVEKRAVRAMEPYKDAESTRGNYLKSQKSVDSLEQALLALAEKDFGAVSEWLEEATQ